MKSILVALDCPQCQYHTYRKSETLIIADFDEQGREQLLNGTFFSLRCPRCAHQIQFLHPLVYVDQSHHFILLVKLRQDLRAQDRDLYAEDTSSIKRILCDATQIAEKIRIFEDALDDRAMEVLKMRMQQKFMKQKRGWQQIRYQDMDRATATLWFEAQKEDICDMLGVRMLDYEKIRQRLPAPSHQCILVDQQWAHMAKLSKNDYNERVGAERGHAHDD